MAFYFFYQKDPETAWTLALADERANILREKNPALASVLDVDATFSDDEDKTPPKYRGPLYIDIDSDAEDKTEKLERAIEQSQKLLTLIQSKGVDLNTVRCWLTGGRGIHIMLDPATFMTKIPPTGILNLPSIYKEMVWSTIMVDDLDLKVYSEKRGRMFRCANVKRENGKYKVSVTADEILNMTPARYDELTSQPRAQVPVEPPCFCPELGLAFSVAQDKVTKKIAARKGKKGDDLKRFNGQWPNVLKDMVNGKGIKEDAGFNQIAMQIALAGIALGKSEASILEDCETLIQAHKGDGTRYGSPNKRRSFLKDMIRYMDKSDTYEFSIGGISALLTDEARAKSDLVGGDRVDVPTVVTEDGEVEVEEQTGPLRLGRNGIFVRTDDGMKSICDLGLLNPVAMCHLTGEHVGYELDMVLDGKDKGKKFLPMNAFSSRSQFHNWALTFGASMKGTDQQAGGLVDVFRHKTGKTVYGVEREGIDIITRPGIKNSDDLDVVWSAIDGVRTNNPDVHYRYHGIYSAGGTFRSDLMDAGPLTLDDEAFVDDLLSINTVANLGKLLGWFSAAFLTQLIRKKFKRFPSLQVYGQAGSGKSMSVILLNHLHYNMVEPRQFSVSGQTNFPIIVAVATSASMPMVFEEVKARQLTKHAKDFLQNILRSNYTADQISRGSLGRDKSVRELTVTDFQNAAPIVFVGEALEDQSAILERCVVVALSKANKVGRDQQFERCLDNATTMGRIGKVMAEAAMSMDRDVLYDNVQKNFKAISGRINNIASDDASRPAFNLGVVLTGLDFLKNTLAQVFGETFDERIEAMREEILSNVMESIPKNMSEASRVLDTMAALSRNPDPNLKLIIGQDYTVSADGKTIDLKVRNAYDKYVRYQRGLGMEVLYDTYNSFQNSLSNYGGVVRRACPDNDMLYDSPRAVIFRILVQYMDDEGVDGFNVR